MSYDVLTIDRFKREAKRLIKKFPSLRLEIEELGRGLKKNPTNGTSLGKGFYKIRMAIQSKGKGKRGGARVITYFKVVDKVVYLVSIYDKSEKSDISQEELMILFKDIPE
jgi:hypothetical protein